MVFMVFTCYSLFSGNTSFLPQTQVWVRGLVWHHPLYNKLLMLSTSLNQQPMRATRDWSWLLEYQSWYCRIPNFKTLKTINRNVVTRIGNSSIFTTCQMSLVLINWEILWFVFIVTSQNKVETCSHDFQNPVVLLFLSGSVLIFSHFWCKHLNIHADNFSATCYPVSLPAVQSTAFSRSIAACRLKIAAGCVTTHQMKITRNFDAAMLI